MDLLVAGRQAVNCQEPHVMFSLPLRFYFHPQIFFDDITSLQIEYIHVQVLLIMRNIALTSVDIVRFVAIRRQWYASNHRNAARTVTPDGGHVKLSMPDIVWTIANALIQSYGLSL
jgi:hypothetical protein